MSSTSGCLPSYPTNLASQYGRQSNDYYSYTNSSDAPVLGPADSMRQGPEMTYRYIDTTNSVTAAPPTTARRDMPTLNSGGISSFPLGHSNSHYMTHQSAAYMMPPGDLGSVGVDAAATDEVQVRDADAQLHQAQLQLQQLLLPSRRLICLPAPDEHIQGGRG